MGIKALNTQKDCDPMYGEENTRNEVKHNKMIK